MTETLSNMAKADYFELNFLEDPLKFENIRLMEPDQLKSDMFVESFSSAEFPTIMEEVEFLDEEYCYPSSQDIFTSESQLTTDDELLEVRSSRASTTESQRWKSWTHEEKMILVGAVVDRFFRIGSLSSRKSNNDEGSDCWDFIKNTYDLYWEKYYQVSGILMPRERTSAALSRHYKVMKAKISSDDQKGYHRYTFRDYYKDFETIYRKILPLLSDKKNLLRTSSFNEGNKFKDQKKRKARYSLPTSSYQDLYKIRNS